MQIENKTVLISFSERKPTITTNIDGKDALSIHYEFDKAHCSNICWMQIPPASSELPAEPYSYLREAHKKGKIIQYQPYATKEWADLLKPQFDGPVECYRIKPSPLNEDDIPMNACLLDSEKVRNLSWRDYYGVNFAGSYFTYDMLMNSGYKISYDGGKTWKPCYKE